MPTRVQLLILGGALAIAGVGFAWYLAVYRPSADEAATETAESFVSAPALTGTAENPASLEDVTIGDDGTIQLAPEGQ